jgi:2-polyprenyl-3-methyl-5-hydroxy-6-metoxy-1,4-benzoquinol methylase
MVGANQPGVRICDVGCGSGFGVEIAAISLLSKHG